jgi:hypothetical protein
MIEGRRMGTVLSFKRVVTPLPRRDPPRTSTAGEIIIFPGVRIERHAGQSAPPAGSDSDDGGCDGVGGKRRPRKSS